jgi:antitoxin component YwqK of YwqJK toxin-antitoxin module
MRSVLFFMLAAACSSGTTSTGKPPDEPPPAPPVDASTAPVNTAAAQPEFWKQGDAACPSGDKLVGAGSKNVYCADSSGQLDGPSAVFDDKGALQELTMWAHGKRDGATTSFYPDGKPRYQATIRQNNEHGTVTRFHPNGQKQSEGTYRDGRPDGTFRAWSPAGVELGSFVMKNGTGTLIEWHDNGQKAWEQPMENGQANGTIVSWHPNGKKMSESVFAHGKAAGATASWDDQGRMTMKGQYRNDEQDGDWTYYDPATGKVARVDRYQGGRQVASIDYQDGKPLARAVSDRCASDDATAEAYKKQTGKELDKEHRCIEHAAHFPGWALIGDFAYDRGCMGSSVMLDCKLVKSVEARTLLDRAGWAAARAPAREKIAMDYVREVAIAWEGSMSDEPEPPKTVRESDGGITITAWIAEPAGMTPQTTRHLTEFRFAAGGALATKVLKSETK